MSNNLTIREWLDQAIKNAPYNSMSGRYQFSEMGLREALRSAIFFGADAKPPFPPDLERIALLERELAIQKEMNRLAKNIMDEKDRMIAVLKPLSEELALLREQRDNRINVQDAIIQQQQLRIAALESDPTNEEARFNIERQYEREFTNTSHLMGQIENLNNALRLMQLQRDRALKNLAEESEKIRAVQGAFDEYRKAHPDNSVDVTAIKEAAERVANGQWDTYRPPYRGTIAVKDAKDYLRDPLRYDGK